jgi:hypothetical protein
MISLPLHAATRHWPCHADAAATAPHFIYFTYKPHFSIFVTTHAAASVYSLRRLSATFADTIVLP